jgi:hypothetical protein
VLPLSQVVADMAIHPTVKPNAYYEAGFADAMHKEVVLVAQGIADLPFDVRSRNAVIYGDAFETLVATLRDQIVAMRLRCPIGV